MNSRGLAVSSTLARTRRRKDRPRKKRPVGFTKDGRLRVGSYSQPGRWYELGVTAQGQLTCEPADEECRSWLARGRCGHVEAGAQFLETHPCFSEEQTRFNRLTYSDRYRQAYRAMREAEFRAACNGGCAQTGPQMYVVK